MLKLKDKNKKLVAGLINYKDLCIESILATGDKKLSFSLPKEDKFYNFIEEEGYIETKTQEYVIKAKDVGVDYTRFDCVLNLETLEANIFDRFESVEQTITNALNLAIVGTGWTVKDNTLKKKRTVRCTNKNALEIVQEIKKTYRVDIVFNTLSKQIEIHEHLGEDKGTYFIDSLNLTALQVQSDSYKFTTRIVAEGKDGLTFEDINNGKNYVENYQYSNKIKTIYWKDERYTVKESLLEDAKAKLEELSKPFTSYNASVLNLAELNLKYKSILDYSLGDTITLLSKSNKVKDKQRIVKTIEWPQDHTKDTVELANATLKFEDIQQENQETTDTVSNITVDNGTVDGSTIDSIQVKQIEDFKANVIEVVNLKAINASIENLHANKADIQDLHAVNAKIGTLEATKANITELNAVSAEIQQLNSIKANIVDLNSATAKIGVLEAKTASIDNLLSQKASINDLNALNATISEALIKKATIAQLEALETKTNNLIADKANIKDLNVANANVNKIQAETANIKTLLNGNLSSENIQAGGITSDKLTIANGFITNLMISSVSASKITAGTIDAAKINVVNLNADNLTVGKINGQLLKDGSISGLAIENGAIDNNKVSPNANIEASKINISSVVTAINEGSTLLTANKVTIDSEKGTLDVAFNNLNTSLEANKKITESNSTAINVVQGKLSASIENSKVLESKQKTLEDNYNITVATVDSLKNTVGQQKTLIDSATGKITSVEVKANTLEKNLSGLTQTVTDTKKVIENNKTVLESKNAELKANIDSVSSSLSSVSSTVDKNNKTLVAKTNTLEQNLNGLTQTVESNKTVTDGKITSVESETHELKAGLGGLTSKLDTLKSTTDGINKTVSNQGSAINQLQDSIKLKVDSSTFTQSTTTINNNINRAKQEAINSANSHADNKANEALNNAKVFVNAEITTVNSHLNKATSEINVLKEKIESKVSQSDIDKSIQNIKFNDVNMILNSGEFKDKSHWSITNGDENLLVQDNNLIAKFKNYAKWGLYVSNNSLRNKPLDVNKDYTVVCKLKSSVETSVNFQIIDGDGGNHVYSKELNLNNEWKLFKFTFKPYQVGNQRQFRFISGEKDYNFDLYINFVKMVEGTTSSDSWSMAPDYVLDNIKTVTDKITTVESKLTQENNSIKASVQDLNSTTQTITTNVSNINRDLTSKINSNLDAAKSFATDIAIAKANLAKEQAIANADGKITEEERKRIQQAQENLNAAIARADKAKQDAINVASTDATNKANNALNSAKTYVNAEITTVNNKVHNVESNLNILSNEIKSKVSQSDIDKSIHEIKIGGRNLIVNSDILQNLFSPLSEYSGTREVIKDDYALCKKDVVFKCTHSGTGFHLPLFTKNSNRIGKTYTWSFWAKCSVNKRGTIGHESNGQTQVEFTTEWKKFSHTWLFGDCTYSSFTFYIGWNVGEVLYIRDFKIEEGTKATDWTAAPEDTNQLIVDSIKVIDTKISDVSSSVTQLRDSVTTDIRAINSKTQSIETTLNGKASKQEVTEVNNRVATIKASLDSITQRVSSTESKTQTLESNINGKASKQEVNNVSSKVASVETSLNGITQRVSSTESNISKTNDRINSLASKEEVAQLKITTNSISTEVSKKVNGRDIISTINQSAESVKINASRINLQGYVTVGDLGSSNVTTINNAHVTSGVIEGRTMIALNGSGRENGILTVNNGESYLEYFRCREAWMMSPYANGWRVPLIHSKFGVKDSETASDMIDEISFYRGTDGRNYLQITNTKTGRVEYIELYRSAFDTVTILNRLDRIDAKLAGL
ncbi:phage tail spike protein [Clostridium perfringens]|uniref:phage tail spike protein n=1 Tax=Clostridium perfringens TaxID=1502 RepID=UPI003F43EFD5